MTQPTGKPTKTFRDTLTELVLAFTSAPVNPIQLALRKAIAGDDLLQDKEYDLMSAQGSLNNLYDSAQKEQFEVMAENERLEYLLSTKGISYQPLDNNTPIVIRFDLGDVFGSYDLTTSNQPRKAKQVAEFQESVKKLQQEYEQLAQDLEAQKVQRTYLTLKAKLYGLQTSEPKNDVEQYQDEVASLLQTYEKQKEAIAEKKRQKIVHAKIIGELYSQDYTLRGNYDVATLQQIQTPENILAYFHGSQELEQTVNALSDKNQKTNYPARKENRIKLTELVQQHPEYQTAVFNVAQGLSQIENGLAEEFGIALANATNQSKYWQFIGDLIAASSTANRPDRVEWQQICYTKAQSN
jgi:hypothetical protein